LKSITSSITPFDTPSNKIPRQILQNSIKRKQQEVSEIDDPNNISNINNSNKLRKLKKDFESVEYINTIVINPSTSFAKIRLSTPKIRLSFLIKSPTNGNLLFEIKNGNGTEQKPTRISSRIASITTNNDRNRNNSNSVTNNSPSNGVSHAEYSKQLFVDFIPKLVNLCTGNGNDFWAISTIDGSILIYSYGGRRLFPPLVLGSTISFLESKGDYLMAVTSIGEVHVWNIKEKKSAFKPANLYSLLDTTTKLQEDILSKSENLTMVSITNKGIPIITLTNGNGYLYDKEMNSWCTISELWWAFGSHYWDATNNANNNNTDRNSLGFPMILNTQNKPTILSLLESKTNEELLRKNKGDLFKKISKIMLMKQGFENLENSISLSHLENKIIISKLLEENEEFKKLLINYCVRISELGLKHRLIEICLELYGPNFEIDESSDFNDSDSESSIDSDFEVRELLREIILNCSKNREVQRVLVRFAKVLEII
ncbi:Hir2p, partial [Ascoidea rubescens DSM 1968]